MKVVLDLDHTLCKEDVENWLEEVIMPSTPCVLGYSFVEHHCGKCHIPQNNEREELIDKACKWLIHNMTDINYIGVSGAGIYKPKFIDEFRKAMEE